MLIIEPPEDKVAGGEQVRFGQVIPADRTGVTARRCVTGSMAVGSWSMPCFVPGRQVPKGADFDRDLQEVQGEFPAKVVAEGRGDVARHLRGREGAVDADPDAEGHKLSVGTDIQALWTGPVAGRVRRRPGSLALGVPGRTGRIDGVDALQRQHDVEEPFGFGQGRAARFTDHPATPVQGAPGAVGSRP